MANTIKIKRGLKANLSKANLQDGEIAFTTDTKELYVSDTTTPINANTTYSISKSGSTITLTGSDGSTSTVSDSNTTYSAASTTANGLMTAAMVTKLNGIATGATKTTIDSSLSSSSTNPVQNKVIYNALAGKAATSAIPTALSQLTNDSNFVTSSEIAENYATKEYVNNMTNTGGLTFLVVETLPEEPVEGTVYLVPSTSSISTLLDVGGGPDEGETEEGGSSDSTTTAPANIYDEYMWISNQWELIGSTAVDLSQYYTKTEIDSTLTNKADTSAIPTKTSQLTNDSGYLTEHQDISGKENISNKVTTITSSSTSTQYPSAKAVYDLFNSITNGDEVDY